MSKITSINKKKQLQSEPKEINFNDLPDGAYKLIDRKRVAVKQNGKLGIFDNLTLEGNGVRVNISLLDREYILQQEKRLIIPGISMPNRPTRG